MYDDGLNFATLTLNPVSLKTDRKQLSWIAIYCPGSQPTYSAINIYCEEVRVG